MTAPTPPPATPPALLVVRDLAGAVWKRRFIAGTFFLATISLVVVGIMICPRTYQSEAKLFVRVGRESVTLDPTATAAGQMMAVQDSRETELNSVVDVLNSGVILATAVDAIGPGVVLGHQSLTAKPPAMAVGTGEQSRGKLMESLGLSDPIGQRELAIAALARVVSISANKKSNVVTVHAKAATPELAQRIVTEVIDAFLTQHRMVNRTEGSYEFFVEQTAELRGQFDAASKELNLARNALGVTSLGEKRAMIQTQVAGLEADLLETRKTLAVTEASVAATGRAIERLPATVAAGSVAGSPNSAADRTRGNIGDLRLREQTLLLRYTNRHPLVVSVREQIRRAETIADDLAPQSLQQTIGPNPVRVGMETKFVTEEALAESLRARADAVEGQLAVVRRELERLNSHEGDLAVLEQRRDVAAGAYREYAGKLEEARLDNELGRGRISNVNVFQPANFIAKPVRPDKRLLFAAGLVFALTGAVGLAIALEYSPLAMQMLRSERVAPRTADAVAVPPVALVPPSPAVAADPVPTAATTNPENTHAPDRASSRRVHARSGSSRHGVLTRNEPPRIPATGGVANAAASRDF